MYLVSCCCVYKNLRFKFYVESLLWSLCVSCALNSVEKSFVKYSTGVWLYNCFEYTRAIELRS